MTQFQIAKRTSHYSGASASQEKIPHQPSDPSYAHSLLSSPSTDSRKYINYLFMRFPSFPTIRIFHTFANTRIRVAHPAFNVSRLYGPPQRVTVLRSMPIPFIGALFGSSSKMADNTNYPVQKTEGEWQAVLSPGTSYTKLCLPYNKLCLTRL
jgi:hypothetical protein